MKTNSVVWCNYDNNGVSSTDIHTANHFLISHFPTSITIIIIIIIISSSSSSSSSSSNGSAALCWTFAALSVSWSYTQSKRIHSRGLSPSESLYMHTGKHRVKAHRHPCLEWFEPTTPAAEWVKKAHASDSAHTVISNCLSLPIRICHLPILYAATGIIPFSQS
jgi:hypothetical protein